VVIKRLWLRFRKSATVFTFCLECAKHAQVEHKQNILQIISKIQAYLKRVKRF